MFTGFFDTSFFQALIANTCATILGVAAGIPAALYINRLIEGRSEQERKKKILQTLKKELNENVAEWDRWTRQSEADVFELPPVFRFESWKALSDGGELQWIKDPELLGVLSEAYYQMRFLMELSQRLFELAHLTNYKDYNQLPERHLRDGLTQGRQNSFNSISEALRRLEEQLETSR